MENSEQSRWSVAIHTTAAIVMGWFSLQIGGTYAVLAGFAVLFATGFALERFIGRKGVKWWLGNGAIIYIFVWIVAWVFFFNMA
jgi:hypothetical protein